MSETDNGNRRRQLPMIGQLLFGHTRVETTARYAHLAQASVREVAVASWTASPQIF